MTLSPFAAHKLPRNKSDRKKIERGKRSMGIYKRTKRLPTILSWGKPFHLPVIRAMSQFFTYASASGVFSGPHARENDASSPT
jgi:hypothetical protein